MNMKFPLLFSGLSAMALLAACGSNSGSQPAADTGATSGTETSTTTEAAPEAGAATDAAAPAAADAGAAAQVVTVSVGGLTGSSDAGKKVFNQCGACHSVKAGENRIGPSLHGIVGEKAAIVPNFKFSKAMTDSGITWTEDNLFKYLEDPQKMVPGTIMAFPGIPDAQKRADVVAYLKSNS